MVTFELATENFPEHNFLLFIQIQIQSIWNKEIKKPKDVLKMFVIILLR